MEKLKNLIESLANQFDEEYCINCGGCCYFAMLIAKELEKLGIKYKLALLDYHFILDGVRNNKREFKNNVKRRRYIYDLFNHYTLYINGIGIINKGDDNEYITISYINADDIEWIYDSSDWNPAYDTNNNETVRNIIENKFKEYVRAT